MAYILGALAATQAILCRAANGLLANRIGLLRAITINFFVATLISGIMVCVDSGFLFLWNGFKNLRGVELLLSAPLNLLFFALFSLAYIPLGATEVGVLIFIGQLITALSIDFLTKGISPNFGSILGILLIVCGLSLKAIRRTRVSET